MLHNTIVVNSTIHHMALIIFKEINNLYIIRKYYDDIYRIFYFYTNIICGGRLSSDVTQYDY